MASHPRRADEMGKAGFLNDFFCTSSPHYVHDLVLPELDEFLVVVVKVESDLCDGKTKPVSFVRELNAIVFPRKDLSEYAKRGPVVVVHHHTTQAPSPCSHGCNHLLCECDLQRADCLNRETSGEVAALVGFVEFFRHCVRGRSLVKANQFGEASGDYVAGLRHQI